MSTGVLLCNTGSPESVEPGSVRKYLAEFLSDPMVVDVPAIVWKPLLYGLILPFRACKTAAKYKAIWTSEGAPLLLNIRRQRDALQKMLGLKATISVGMRYGSPSLYEGIQRLKKEGCRRVLVLPLFPQYSRITTGSILNKISHQQHDIKIEAIQSYFDHPAYVSAIAGSIRSKHRGDHLVISFHSLPKRLIRQGDPYEIQCRASADRIANSLGLSSREWSIAFQSRFGFTRWLEPRTSDVLGSCLRRGIKKVSVVCPGFSADCLETLQEIGVMARDLFLRAGGEDFCYIPALNDSEAHLQAMVEIVERVL